MSIAKIIINGQNINNMGDDCTESDAAGYRAYLRAALEDEYPGVEIEINEADSTRSVCVETDGQYLDAEIEDAAESDVNEFVQHCWDHCDWEWVA